MNVKIVTDGGCDIPQEYLEKYRIDMLDIPITDGSRDLREHKDIEVSEIFSNMRNNKTVYKTSQVTRIDYYNCFTKYAEEGRPLIYISLSSGITGGYGNACLVRDEVLEKYKDAKIHVADSFCATGGFALLVLRVGMMAMDGCSYESIVDVLKHYKLYQDHIWTVTTFEYLVRGGRVSKAAATVGGLLNIKPILEINKENGKLLPIDKVRGEKLLYKHMCDHMKKRSYNGEFNKNQTIAIGYGDNPDMREKMLDQLINYLGVKEENILQWPLGAVVGSHTGPDYVACYYLQKLAGNPYDIIE